MLIECDQCCFATRYGVWRGTTNESWKKSRKHGLKAAIRIERHAWPYLVVDGFKNNWLVETAPHSVTPQHCSSQTLCAEIEAQPQRLLLLL